MSHQPDLREERALWRTGCVRVAGVDEAGRGAWAGPVVAAAVVLAPCFDEEVPPALRGVRDSKLLSPSQRERLADVVRGCAQSVGVGVVSAEEIDATDIVAATRQAMSIAVGELDPLPDCLLIDALYLPSVPVRQIAIIKGDRYCLSVAAASIIAKVARDGLMRRMDAIFPGYGFGQHKGYGTEAHRRALIGNGPCAQHRHTYAPVRDLLEMRGD